MEMHEPYMQRCIALARRAIGKVSPNPMVGAVIVYNGQIIGEGWHQRYGGPHAEVNAIRDVETHFENGSELLKNTSLYVNLEPCVHHGKTPPCTDLILQKKIPRVYVGCVDPNPRVSGKGIKKLLDAGVTVKTGILEGASRSLNARFITAIEKQRPYIILKWAKTANGYFSNANGATPWLTSSLSKSLVHRWRSEEDAVLVAKNTALTDNPRLTVRDWEGRNPMRVVIDWNLSLPPNLHLFDQEATTLIFNGVKDDQEAANTWIRIEFRDYLIQHLLYQLHLKDVQSVLIEGGKNLLEQFIYAGLWDEARVFTAPFHLEKGLDSPVVHGKLQGEWPIGPDRLSVYTPSL